MEYVRTSGIIRMWSERGKCGGKVQHMTGNALVADFATYLLIISREFNVSLSDTYHLEFRISEDDNQV